MLSLLLSGETGEKNYDQVRGVLLVDVKHYDDFINSVSYMINTGLNNLDVFRTSYLENLVFNN